MSDHQPADGVHLSLAEVEALTRRALIACGVDARNEPAITASVVAAEADRKSVV